MRLPIRLASERHLTRVQLLLLVAGSVALLALIATVAGRWADVDARRETRRAAEQLARANAGLLSSELQKFRLLPLVLSDYPDIPEMLASNDAAAVARVNARLALLADRTDAAVIYVIDRSGRTAAASNYRAPTSFVGQDYGFRPYFREAMRDGSAELFALGTVSGRPGLYIARRIDGEAAPLGVIVVKIEFEALQSVWASQAGTTFVTDSHGITIIASRPGWRFHRARQLDAGELAEIREARQFGALPLPPLPVARQGEIFRTRDGARHLLARAGLPSSGIELFVLAPLAPALQSAEARSRIVTFAAFGAMLVILAGVFWARDRQAVQARARRMLEREVADRTSDLRLANARLTEESAERARADARYRAAREELAQANRLASIGQITAGVAHEINQPVAAIRSYADNAATFLDRGREERARANLATIVGLTERIGTITAELRSFARRRTPSVGPIAASRAIDSSMILIGDRIRGAGVRLERVEPDAELTVVADRVRLEQVLVNLLQNALDALAGREAPHIRIETGARAPGQAFILVADNGPGIAPDVAARLFEPFVTGREDGLGLGLAIARQIARDFGGDLRFVASPLGGAAFRLDLPRP